MCYIQGIKIIVRLVLRTTCLLLVINKEYMCDSKCGGNCGECTPSLIGKILLIIGGINWGLVGVGMLAGGNDWNVIHIVFESMPTVEGIIYVLVGIAAIMKIFHCRCKKCMSACGSCGADSKTEGTM